MKASILPSIAIAVLFSACAKSPRSSSEAFSEAQDSYIKQFVENHPSFHNQAVIPSGGDGTNTAKFIFRFYTASKEEKVMEVTFNKKGDNWIQSDAVELANDLSNSLHNSP
jgi:hypothetical protein